MSLFLRSLGSVQVWALALLSAVPPDAVAVWQAWDIVDPGYVGTLIAWWPVDSFLRLALLAWFIHALAPQRPLRDPLKALLPAINAEALLSLRVGIRTLLFLIPSLTLMALLGVESLSVRLGLLGLAALGFLAVLPYYMRRSLAQAGLLLQPMTGATALDWSEARLAGRLKPYLWLALPFWALGLGLDGLNLLLSLGDSFALTALGWALAVPSLCATLLPIAYFVASDETA